MADLDPLHAKQLAESLMTMGHPYQIGAIQATAFDLVTLCKGCFRDGRIITPKAQAEALIDEIRTMWDDWPEHGGTKQLYALFRRMFGPAPPDPSAQREQWKRECGPPDKAWSEKLIKTAATLTGNKHEDFKAQLRAMLMQAIEDAIDFTEGEGEKRIAGNSQTEQRDQAYWRESMKHHNREHPQEVAEVRAKLARQERNG